MENLKVGDIRLGNYYDHNGEYKQVTPNTILEVWEAERSWCKPIPLTEDILLKCGFELDEYLYLKISEYLSIIWIGYLSLEVNGNIISIGDSPFLHQLQNLYFALTNTELTIKL